MNNDYDSDRHDDSRHQRITQRAFARFEARGGLHGYDVEDWLEAEREADAEMARENLVATPPPGLAPRVSSGNPQRDEESRREAERVARNLNRDAQRQLVR